MFDASPNAATIHARASPLALKFPSQLAAFTIALCCLLSTWYFATTIAPQRLGRSNPTVHQGLVPEWIGCREILRHRSPYTSAVTRQIQIAVYERPAAPGVNEQRFAYPLYVVVLFGPIALLPLWAAYGVALVGCLLLTIGSVSLWSRPDVPVTLATVLVLSAYPVVVGLQLCQPTLLFCGLLALVVHWLRTRRLVAAGVLAAVCTAKPQLALPILLPLAIWTLLQWRQRKFFLVSLSATMAMLLLSCELAVPRWIPQWLGTVRAYAHYAGAQPLLMELVGGRLFLPAASVLVAWVIWVCLKHVNSDLQFVLGLSVAVFQLLVPFLIYNEVLLLPATLWLLENRKPAGSQLQVLLCCCSWTVLGLGWVAAVSLTLWDIVSPGSAVRLWSLPLFAAWIYPWPVFLALTSMATRRAHDLGSGA